MNMKRTIALVLTIAICATMALGGTLAFLTDTEKAVNIMTVGNVEIKQSEQERGENGLQDFTQNQSMVPAVYPETVMKEEVTVNGYTVEIRKNVKNYVDKIVSVKNTGIVDAYVRNVIAIPSTPGEANNKAYDNWLHWNGVSHTDTTPNNGWFWGTKESGKEWPGNNSGWNRIDDVVIGGKEYDLFVATNVNALKPGEGTSPSLLGFYLDERVDAERLSDGTLNHYIIIDGVKHNLGDLTNLKIYVATQAVQADGFENAWEAMDRAFGAISATNHPWSDNGAVTPEEELNVTEDDILVVGSAADLMAWAQKPMAYKGVKLDANIDMSGFAWTPANMWNPESKVEYVIDGAGYTISNLDVNAEAKAGLIGSYAGKALTIKDLTIEHANVKSSGSFVGTLIGYQYGNVKLENVTLDDVHVSTAAKAGIRIGGFVGGSMQNDGAKLTMEGCTLMNSTVSGYHNVGGLVGSTSSANALQANDCSILNSKLYYSATGGVGASYYGMGTSGYAALECAGTNTVENVEVIQK